MFVDLNTRAHLGLMFCLVLLLWFCFVCLFVFFFFFLGLLSSEVGLGFRQLEKSAKGKTKKEKQRKWNSSV